MSEFTNLLETAVAEAKALEAKAAEGAESVVAKVESAVDLAKLKTLMASFEHDVSGKCWQLWEGLKALVAEAEKVA